MAWISTVWMLLALAAECIWHPLASALFDITSDYVGLLGVLLVSVSPAALDLLYPKIASAEPERAAEWARWARGLGAVALCFATLLHALLWMVYLVAIPVLIMGVCVAFIEPGAAAAVAFCILALAPLPAWITLLVQMKALRALTDNGARSRRIYWIALTLAALLFIVRPIVVGYHVQRAIQPPSDFARERSLDLLRLCRAEHDLLVVARRRPPTYGSFLAGGTIFAWNFGAGGASVDSARKVYFLMTGRSHTKAPSLPATFAGLGFGNWSVHDEETGGDKVGTTIAGLSLARSRQDVRLDPDGQTAQTQWTLTFANKTDTEQEARATVTLPDGAVISDAWLWIDGRQCPAAFGGKEQVRAAYKEVAVVYRRDPLLVTCTDPRRVLVQCFPVPAGKTMQIRLQITQPVLDGRLVPAALTDINFETPSGLAPEIRVDGAVWKGGPLSVRALTLPSGLRQVPPRAAKAADITVAVDPSAAVGAALDRGRLVAALRSLPAGSRVRFVDTRFERGEQTAWVDATAVNDDFLRRPFVGGVDPVPALQRLCVATGRPSAILWLHAPVPEEAVTPESLAAAHKATKDAPALVGLLVTPGEDVVMDALMGDRRVDSLDGVDFGAAVRRAALAAQPVTIDPDRVPLGGHEPAIGGIYVSRAADTDSRTDWARLAATSRVLAAWYSVRDQDRLARAAAARRLVTPLSGCVVLATRAEYERHHLDPDAQAGSPPPIDASSPEPGALALLTLGGAALFALHRKKSRSAP